METPEIIQSAHEALKEAFGQDGYTVHHSDLVCNLKRCTSGNKVLCKDGITRGFRRWIDVDKKRVYWAFAFDNHRLLTYKY